MLKTTLKINSKKEKEKAQNKSAATENTGVFLIQNY